MSDKSSKQLRQLGDGWLTVRSSICPSKNYKSKSAERLDPRRQKAERLDIAAALGGQANHAPYGAEEYTPSARSILAKHINKQAQAGERDPRWLADSALLYLSQQKLGRMLPNKTFDPEYWRKRAVEARTIADQMNDVHTNGIMLGIATSYEKIARWIEERIREPQ